MWALLKKSSAQWHQHKNRGRFVATHPMWGTEYSGPEAAVKNAFAGKATVICNKEDSDKDAVELVEKVYGC
jgi:prephenate dehydrogenase